MSASPRKPIGFLTSFPVFEGKGISPLASGDSGTPSLRTLPKGASLPLETRGFGATTASQFISKRTAQAELKPQSQALSEAVP